MLEGILPLPTELCEQLIMAAVEEGYQLDWPASHILASMEKFLVRKRAACQAAYETKVWSEVHSYENYKFDHQNSDDLDQTDVKSSDIEKNKAGTKLRKLKSKIYASLKSGQHLQKHLRKLRSNTDNFIKKFK